MKDKLCVSQCDPLFCSKTDVKQHNFPPPSGGDVNGGWEEVNGYKVNSQQPVIQRSCGSESVYQQS